MNKIRIVLVPCVASPSHLLSLTSKSWLFDVAMYSRFIAVLYLFLVFLGIVSAVPSPDIDLRQVASVTVPAALASPTSVTTTNTVQT